MERTNVWRFVHTGSHDPAYNMAVDEAIMHAHREGKVPPTIRFYGWNPATLSIGYFQRAESEVDFEMLRSRGIGFVRRPTGGRAVLHDQELTYSMIVSEEYPGMPRSVTEAYRVLSEGLVIGFNNLDLDAEMVQLGNETEKKKFAAASSAACFDAPSWYELVVEGRKVAGSAQTRQKGVILQHGSILMELDIELLFSLLKFSSERLKERLKASFPSKAAAIQPLRESKGLGHVTMEEIERAFKTGLQQGLQIELIEDTLTKEEQAHAEHLIQTKYNHDDWNLKR